MQKRRASIRNKNAMSILFRNAQEDYFDLLRDLRHDFERAFIKDKPSPETGIEKFDFSRVLGSGSFGVVVLCKERVLGNYYACKLLEKAKIVKRKQIEHSLNEKKMLKAFTFPFIVHMDLSFKDNVYLYFMLEYIRGGDLWVHLKKLKRFEEEFSKFICAQVFLALEFMQFCNVLYRDLKPENIMLDHRGYIKLADLGFCKVVEGRTWTLCGTPDYLAPEVLLNIGYGKSVDWWTFGVLLYELNAGFTPFYSSTGDDMMLYENILSGKYRFPAFFSTELKDLIKGLLQHDITRRFGNMKNGPGDIRNHRWFNGMPWLGIYQQTVTSPYIPVLMEEGDMHFESKDDYAFNSYDENLYQELFLRF